MTWPIAQGDNPPVTLSVQDWQIGQDYIDAQGNRTNAIRCPGAAIKTPLQRLKASGYRANYLTYQPANRFWTFQ